MHKKIKWESKHIEIDEFGKFFYPEDEVKEEEFDDDDDFQEFKMFKPKKIMNTALGMFEVDDGFNPFKQFKIWKAYTNFNITDKLLLKINNATGVELLYPFSRYSFLVGVGEMFEFSEVRKEIDGICNIDSHIDLSVIEDDECRNRTKDLIKKLKETNKSWSLFVFPNGNIDFTLETEKEYSYKRLSFQNLEKEINGVFIDHVCK